MASGKRLIDANILKTAFENAIKVCRSPQIKKIWLIALKAVNDCPTVDAVEVVRCKDCKSCKLCYPEKQIGKEATPGWYCKKHKSYRRPDDFCSYGERREGE